MCKNMSQSPNVSVKDEWRELIMKELREMDEKDYIPLEDFLYMLDRPWEMTLNEYIQSTKDNPEEWKRYLNDSRPLDRGRDVRLDM